MLKMSIDEIQFKTLRLVIIESTIQARFSLIVCIENETFEITESDGSRYLRNSIEEITTDLCYCNITDLFLHINMNMPLSNIPREHQLQALDSEYIHLGHKIMIEPQLH